MIPGVGKKRFLFSKAPRSAVEPAQPAVQWISETLYPEVKRSELESDHSPSYSAEIKNSGAIPPNFHTHLWRARWKLINGRTVLTVIGSVLI